LEELLRGNRERFLHLASANPQIIDCVSGDTLTFVFLQLNYSIHISLEKSSFTVKPGFFRWFLASMFLRVTLARRFFTEFFLRKVKIPN
jgi:hypothetical protein